MPRSSCYDDEILDEEVINFVRKLKRGISKYKGKLPLISFNYSEIGHFAAKCPHKNSNDQEEAPNKAKKNQRSYDKKGKKKLPTYSFSL